MKTIKRIGEKRKQLSEIFRLRNAAAKALDDDDPIQYNDLLDEMGGLLRSMEAA